MPCIRMPRVDNRGPYKGACGKNLDINTDYFRDVEDAYKGDKPICPKCRKVLGLAKKVIKKEIKSVNINRTDNVVLIKYTTKETIELILDFNLDNGFFVEDFKDIEAQDIETINRSLKNETLDYARVKKRRMEFSKNDFDVIEKVIGCAKSNGLSDIDIEQLLEIKNKFKIHLL